MADLDPISQIHAALEPLLRPYFAKGKWHIETVPYPLSPTEFKRLMGVTPWIGLSWREFKTDDNAGRQLMGVHQLVLTFAVKNAAGREARFLGDRVGPGLFPSLATAAAVLHGRTLVDIGTLHVVRAGQAYAEGFGDLGEAIGMIELTCRTKFGDLLGAVADAPEFARLVSTFSVGPEREDALTSQSTTETET